MEQEFYVRFWGVRGTIPVPGKSTLRYGGNTSCVEVRCGGRQIIFDAGTGLYALGQETDIFHTDILLSHTHLDHIQGLPFFRPLHKKISNVALWAGHLQPERTVEEVAGHIMQSPIFPLTLEDVQSHVEFNDFIAGETLKNEGFQKAGIQVDTMPLHHPDKATAYRLTCDGKSICYVTDVEHVDGQLDSALMEFIEGANVFIYDCTFDDDDFARHKGWGHSTWQQAVRLAERANVKTLVVFHHDPGMTDDLLDERGERLTAMRANSIIAKEGLVLKLI